MAPSRAHTSDKISLAS